MLKTTTVELCKLVKSSSEAMIIIDGDGKIVLVNKELVKLFGYPAKVLTGANLDLLLPESFRKKHAKHLRKYFSKPSVRPMSKNLDLYGCRKDGTEFPVEVTLHPFETEQGALTYAAIRDISKFKQSEAALRENQILLKTIVDNMPAAIFLRDGDGRFVLVNRTYEEMYGVTNADVRGKTLVNVFPKEEARKYSDHDARVIKEKSVIEEEAKARTVKGEIILSSSKFPILDDSGEIVGVAGVEYDITEHKRAVAELEKAEGELRERANYFRMLGRTAEHSNTATTFEEAIQSFLTDVCMFTGWPVGHAYVRPPDGADRLNPTRIWHMHEADRFADFRKVTEKTQFEPGVGLPGRVLASGKPEWITDVTKDANFPRAKLANDIGVRAGFAIPVLVGTEVVAVLEFFSTDALEPDDSLLMTFMQTGAQLGRVAERSRAEKALRESQAALEQNKALLDTMLDNIPAQIFLRNLEGRYQFINASYAKLYNVTKEQAVGKEVHDILPKSNVDHRLKVDKEVIRKGCVAEHDFILPDDSGERIFAAVKFPVFDALGKVTSVGGFAIEVTEHRRAEEALRQSEKRLQSILESSPIGATIVNADGTFEFVNSRMARMVGLTKEQFLASKARDLYLNPTERDRVSERLMKEGRLRDVELQMKKSDGTPLWILLSFEPTGPEDKGRFFGWVYDISRRKKAEQETHAAKEQAEAALADLKQTQDQLVRSQKMASLGQLTAGIAHEIKNPLNFVNNFAETCVELMDELKQEFKSVRGQFNEEALENVDDLFETLTGDLGKINQHGRRADDIVKSMLLHARGDVLDRVETALNPLVLEALKLAYHGERAKDKSFQVTLEEHLEETAGEVEVMPQEITRVLVNLFGNAFYAVNQRARETGDGNYQPTVSIATLGSGDDVEIRVRDNGTGIPEDIREKLFEPFFTTKPPGEGTGLGLSMCFDIIVQQHGGQMSVDSKAGEFTEFSIALPRHTAEGTVQD